MPRMSRAARIALAVTLVAVFGVTLASFANAEPVAATIAFEHYQDGGPRIHTIKSDGTNPTDLVSGSHPTWDPGGLSIGFSNGLNGGFNHTDLTGTLNELPQLSSYMVWPSLSPDRTKILYGQYATYGYAFWVSNADGTDAQMILDDSMQRIHPSWSPDGTKILYESYDLGTGARSLWIANADGSASAAIPNTPAGSYYPSWTPDGASVVFSCDLSGNYVVMYACTIETDGDNLSAVGPGGRQSLWPTMSPDGTKIAFASFGMYGNFDEVTGIFVMDTNGENVSQLTTGWDSWPRWQPTVAEPPTTTTTTTEPTTTTTTIPPTTTTTTIPPTTTTTTTTQPNQKPVAKFKWKKSDKYPKTIYVAAYESYDPDGSIVNYEWRWGDHTAPKTGKWQWHSYPAKGTYYVFCTVTDNSGAKHTKVLTVTV